MNGEHNFALHVKGNSMEPEFKEGETLVINPTAKAENGDNIIVKNDEEEATFKQYKRESSERAGPFVKRACERVRFPPQLHLPHKR